MSTAHRPPLLMILCILSYIGNGFGVLSAMLGFLAARMFAHVSDDPESMEQMEELMESYGEVGTMMMANMNAVMEHLPMLSAVKLVLCVAAILGITQMYRMRKRGFLIYTTALTLEIIVPPMIAGALAMNWFGGLFSILFILAYASQLRYMR